MSRMDTTFLSSCNYNVLSDIKNVKKVTNKQYKSVIEDGGYTPPGLCCKFLPDGRTAYFLGGGID